ncbi:diacylglycerol/polyprenol kinase family protein [Leptospira kanakyensis]|uniref:Dolichol kinase n=1 Tax=Leptospira kanakyensis TaxID=2484968 RepID=A0A6N4Q3V5_9LEPT|nr:dolichol kinase [Leptospira kanakyensis]MCW7471075.1 dolichol kinase [Leptospira kanakyensis]TGK53672.1 dolichol kinase [Leptospira kanakyensis]TGK57466.1 dolichol kinase [Leptospira kanakyensis]TGK73177.1 dolichol kinase [Leptospira kanakyensis]
MNSGFNFFRKIWHVLGLIIPVTLFFDPFKDAFSLVFATRAILVSLLGILLVSLLILEFVRLNHSGFENFFYKYFGFLMKESERKRFNGTVPYFFANFLVVLFFPAEVAILAILFLVIGDPFAAFVGSKYGKHRFYNGKSLEGIIGFLFPAFIFSILALFLITKSEPGSFLAILDGQGNLLWTPIYLVFFSVVSACVTEFFANTTAKGLVDDNLLIPIVGAVVLSVLSLLYLDYTPMDFFFDPKALYIQK